MPSIGPYRFTDTDASRTFSNLGMWWHHLTDGIAPCPADPDGRAIADALAAIVGAPHGLASTGTSTGLADQLDALGSSAATLFAGNESSARATDALAHVWNGIRRAMATLRSMGAVPTSGEGRVDQINVSNGGVPKVPVEMVEINHGGIVGDRQGSRQHHGRPWQALCLWSAEVIESFAAAGNPLRAGAAGENLTVRGLGWNTIRPGMHLRIGTVLAETTSWAIPCRHNAQWFADGDFRQMSHERGAVSRIYATVLESGSVSRGDVIRVQA